uniref:Intraflagellar transport 74 n=1 Tax=Mastacembelus armatus TaxID=205130 RepID=A0A7N8XWW1_9TELE
MASHRPPSSMGRPVSRSGSAVHGLGRPPTAARPPATAIRVTTGMVPGTSGHPGMRSGIPIGTPGVLLAQIKVTDRPVTQQGLSGMKTGMKGPQRQILDKSYYLGLLRSKINELSTETSKLHKEIDNYNQENSVYLSYEKRAEGLAAEIKDLQGQLADYNMLVDKLNTNTEMEEMINDYNIVSILCKQYDSFTDIFYLKEEAIRAIEEEIRRQKQVADEVVQSMPAAKQEKYFNMATANEELLQVYSGTTVTFLAAVAFVQMFYLAISSVQELAHSQIKQEVVRLHETLSALEAKRDIMEAEHKSLGSPQEEREKLFKQVSSINNSIFLLGECQQKYKELKRKEEEIDRFLESFEESRTQEQEKMTQSQEDIISLLEHCSRNMLRLRQVDTVTASELRNMQEVLVSKETEMVQSESTARGLATESQRLQHDLDKVQQLEGKITGELNTLKERVSTMESELHTYRDLDTLRKTAEEKKKVIQTTLQTEMISRDHREIDIKLLEEMNQKYEALKTKLQENETHAQLANLERKWQHLEQNNFLMKEFIASKSQESDYASVAKNVFQQVAESNKNLIDSQQNNRS